MGLKLGPLSKADLIGLDTCLNVMKGVAVLSTGVCFVVTL
jgi:3-hydroxyacyl-CoA dehydrogenase